MREPRPTWTTVGFCLVFGSLAGLLGLYGGLALLGLIITADRFTWPEGAYLTAAAILHLTSAAACGYTCVSRLNGRTSGLWAAIGLILVVATVRISIAWFPFYYFFGM
jgi:hypothetical protein